MMCYAGSVGLELAAGKDGKAVVGQPSGYYQVDNWIPCPHIPGSSSSMTSLAVHLLHMESACRAIVSHTIHAGCALRLMQHGAILRRKNHPSVCWPLAALVQHDMLAKLRPLFRPAYPRSWRGVANLQYRTCRLHCGECGRSTAAVVRWRAQVKLPQSPHAAPKRATRQVITLRICYAPIESGKVLWDLTCRLTMRVLPLSTGTRAPALFKHFLASLLQ